MSGENDKVVNGFVVRPTPDGGVFVPSERGVERRWYAITEE